MAVVSLATIKGYFNTGDVPTEAEYINVWDSFRHVMDSIPASQISGLGAFIDDRVGTSGPGGDGGGGSSSSGVSASFINESSGTATLAMFIGSGNPGAISKSTDGVAKLTTSLLGGFAVAIPSEYIGRNSDGTVTFGIQFPASHPFYQSEVSMFPPTAHFYLRSTEDQGGFDVELRGNNPQSRILPFTTPGLIEVQIAGVPSSKFMLVLHA